MKGRIIKKLKSFSTITSLKQGLVFRTTNLSNHYFQTSTLPKECEKDSSFSELVGGGITVSEIIKDVQDNEHAPAGPCENDKANCRPPLKSEGSTLSALDDHEEIRDTLEHQSHKARTLTSSDHEQLLEESRIVKYHIDYESGESVLNSKIDQSLSDSTPLACYKKCEVFALLREYEEKCPPGGSESVVFYTTSMRGIRKTFEDCNCIRSLLESFRVEYYERDVSMHLEYREELWRIMDSRVVPPRLFVRGRYIGGADEVVGLHERGMLMKILQGIPLTPNNCSCNGCAGVRFVLCFNCNGSRKIIIAREGQGSDQPAVRCSECNENGLVKCPICSLNK